MSEDFSDDLLPLASSVDEAAGVSVMGCADNDRTGLRWGGTVGEGEGTGEMELVEGVRGEVGEGVGD